MEVCDINAAIDIETTRESADAWYQDDNGGRAVGLMQKLVVTFDHFAAGWFIDTVGEHLTKEAAKRAFAKEAHRIS